MSENIDTITKGLGEFIGRRRALVGLTQAELAKRLNDFGYRYGPTAISTWENEGKRPPIDNPDFARALAIVLEVSLIELYRAAGILPDTPEIARHAILAMLANASQDELDDFESYLQFKFAGRKKRKGS